MRTKKRLRGEQMERLKREPCWIGWNREHNTKVPYSVNGYKTGTSVDHQKEWTTYDAVDAEKFTGIGLVLQEGYFLIDKDHADPKSEEVTSVVNSFGTYAEISPSGNGVHIIGKCDLSRISTEMRDGVLKLSNKYYSKNSKAGYEVYIGGLTNRFATYTGNVISSSMNIVDCTDALLAFLETYMKREEEISIAVTENNDDRYITLTEDDIPEIISSLRGQKNGIKFASLFEEGEIPADKTASEADASLCAMIAFRAGPNPPLIDAIFRESALYRDKWDRSDYASMTIRAGIKACNGVFHHSLKKKPPFVVQDEKGRVTISATRLAAYVKDHLDFLLVNETARSDFAVYVYRDGVYRLYSKEMFTGAVKKFIEDYDPNLVKMGIVKEAVSILCNSEDYVPIGIFNQNEKLVNVQNGLLNLDNMTLMPHSSKAYSSVQIPVDWKDHDVRTPVFDEYLDMLTGGSPDKKRLLLEFLGACFSNVHGYRMKKSLFMYGPGNSGKSQLKRLAERMVGLENHSGIDLAQMEARFGTSDIYGKRISGSSDMSFMKVAELKIFKKATGGDALFAEFKGVNSFRFVYTGLLWFCMNRLPKFGGDDGKWVYDRIIPFHCPNVIEDSKQDSKILDKMYEERNGIFRKAILAFREVIRDGYRFHEPSDAEQIRKQYRIENNTALEFFVECMQKRTTPAPRNNPVTVDKIYSAYCCWYKTNYKDFYLKTRKEFWDDITDYLGKEYSEMKYKGSQGICLLEYTLTQEAADEYGDFILGTKVA